MKPIQPKDHPSFIRALGLAHGRLMASRSALARMSPGAPSRDDSDEAMARLARQAYRDAVQTLERECSRRARVEYNLDGATFIDEACRKLLSKNDAMAALVARALSESRGAMPSQVQVRLDFGLREDGLVFGTARHKALGGSFQSLQEAVRGALERLLDSDESIADTATMRLALIVMIEQSLPVDHPDGARPLAAHVDDLSERFAGMAEVDLQADAESRHLLTGPQASARIAQISLDADAERPNAAAVSTFLSKLGI